MNFQPAMLVNSGVYLQWIFKKNHPEVFAPRRHMTLISNLSKAFRFPNDPNTNPNLSEFHGVSRFITDPNKIYSFEARLGSVPVIRKSDGFLVCVCLDSRDSIHLFPGKKQCQTSSRGIFMLLLAGGDGTCDGFFGFYLDLTSKRVKICAFFFTIKNYQPSD